MRKKHAPIGCSLKRKGRRKKQRRFLTMKGQRPEERPKLEER